MERTLRIGVLALQGAFREHARSLGRLGAEVVEVRQPEDLEGLDGLVVPGGESTTMMQLAEHLHVDSEVSDTRRADEDAGQREIVSRQLDVRLEAPHLAPVGVPVDLEIDEPEIVAVEHDHPCAGTEHRSVE